jgi:tetratricopeptide (TPR) repeat protein
MPHDALIAAEPAGPLGRVTLPRRVRWVLLLVALVACAVYANSLPNDFTYDDRGVIVNNPTVLGTEWTAAWHTGYWFEWQNSPDRLYRPLTIISYIANQALTPGNPWPFHLVNVLLHGLVTLLVGLLAWRLTRHPLATLVAALAFAVHPLHTEVVANVVGRAELLAALWSLLTILIYLDSAGPDEAPRPWWHGLLVGACFLLAMLSKETPVALPAGLVLIDLLRWWHARGRPSLLRFGGRQCLRYYLPITLCVGGYLALRINAVGLMSSAGTINPLVNPLVQASIAERLVTPFLLLGKYLALLAWPRVLVADYSAPSLMPTANLLDPLVLLGIMTAVGCAAALGSFRRHPGLALIAGLFALGYLPVANLVRIGTIFGERLFYWPSVFACIALGIGAVHLVGRLSELRGARHWRFAAGGLACAALALLSIRTIARNPDWHDNVNLALATAADNLTSAKACSWAGGVLINQTDEKWTQDFGAELLRRAVLLSPKCGSAYMDLARFYGRRGDLPNSLLYLTRAAKELGGRTDTRLALAGVLQDLEHAQPDVYMPLLKVNLEKRPKDPSVYLAWGLAQRAQGQLPAAEESIRKAMKLDGYYVEASAELAMLKLEEHQPEAAVPLLREYLRLVGPNAIAECALIKALLACDAQTSPGALREAEQRLRVAESAPLRDPQLNALRSELLRKQADGRAAAARRVSQPVAVGSVPEARPF